MKNELFFFLVTAHFSLCDRRDKADCKILLRQGQSVESKQNNSALPFHEHAVFCSIVTSGIDHHG